MRKPESVDFSAVAFIFSAHTLGFEEWLIANKNACNQIGFQKTEDLETCTVPVRRTTIPKTQMVVFFGSVTEKHSVSSHGACMHVHINNAAVRYWSCSHAPLLTAIVYIQTRKCARNQTPHLTTHLS